eukprot:Protomagalhaensia_sp_Gyna_25__5232@NODE_636_length_2949_cov_715_214089_g495_i0_p7_GENE_NODE_636_length_2949_cov_715_214089_g495_i0NODE_636_length_2949_cov_715_214089_g495_i0_p7_ORF_typecomplete_len143_score5_03Inhibitor_Mig6/PF11555_8/0_049_NODE_636_length_2949_cov_715_214089_g495_i015591987
MRLQPITPVRSQVDKCLILWSPNHLMPTDQTFAEEPHTLQDHDTHFQNLSTTIVRQSQWAWNPPSSSHVIVSHGTQNANHSEETINGDFWTKITPLLRHKSPHKGGIRTIFQRKNGWQAHSFQNAKWTLLFICLLYQPIVML